LHSLDAKLLSIGDKRTLLDAYGQPALQMERKMLTLHGTWLMTNPRTGQRVAEVKPSLMSLSPCEWLLTDCMRSIVALPGNMCCCISMQPSTPTSQTVLLPCSGQGVP
jgi:hypothetical protein